MDLLKAEKLARQLMDEHGLKDWAFKWNRAKKQFGLCSERKKTIFLSKHMTPHRKEENVKNTILHEIAHALVGCRNGHNWCWRSRFLSIGGNGERCSNDVDVHDVSTPKYIMIDTVDGSLVKTYIKTPSAKVRDKLHLYYPRNRPERKGKLKIEPFSMEKHGHLLKSTV